MSHEPATGKSRPRRRFRHSTVWAGQGWHASTQPDAPSPNNIDQPQPDTPDRWDPHCKSHLLDQIKPR